MSSVVIDALTSVVTALGFLPQGTSATPVVPLSPWNALLELIYAARRDLPTLVDHAPTAAPVQTQQLQTGEITGLLGAADADGDTLTYRVVSAPTNGRVGLTADGKYVYVPDPTFAAKGGTDSFTVAVDDGRHALVQTDAAGSRLSLFGGTGVTTAAVSVTVAPTLGITEDFYAVNLTSKPLVFRGYGINDGGDSGPQRLTVLQPGDEHHFTVNYYVLTSSKIEAVYGTATTDLYSATFTVDAISSARGVTCAVKSSSGDCNKVSPNLAKFLDDPKTVIDIPVSATVLKAEVIDRLCGEASRATCSYTPTSRESVLSAPHPVGQALKNNVADDNTQTITTTATQTVSGSLNISASASANLLKLISVGVNGSIGGTISKSESFGQNIVVTAAGFEVVTISAETPLFRDHGDLTVQIGNTTIRLRDVIVDSPDVNSQIRYTINSRLLDQDERDTLPVGVTLEPAAPPADDPAAPSPVDPPPVIVAAGPSTTARVFTISRPTDPPTDVADALGRFLVAAAQSLFPNAFNQSPTASPVQGAQLATGEVTGTLGASDPNGDALSYRVADTPSQGQVVVAADGSYVYTPNRDFALTGGTDTFTVTVDDGRRALFQTGADGPRLSLFGDTGTAAVPVSVTVTPTLGITSGFDIINATSTPLTFAGYSHYQGEVAAGPKVGSVLQPGAIQHFELTYYLTKVSDVTAVYGTATTPDLYAAQLTLENLIDFRHVRCATKNPCSTADPSTVTFLDRAGTVVEFPKGQGGDFLNRVCGVGGLGQCSVNLKSQVAVQSPKIPVGYAIINNSNRPASTSLSVSKTYTEGISLSVGGKLSASFLSFLSTEISASYQRSFTETKSLTQTVSVVVPKDQGRAITSQTPLLRVTGDFLVKLGNSTFIARDVYLDTPDPNGQGAFNIDPFNPPKPGDGQGI